MKKRRELFARLGLGFFGAILVLMGYSNIYGGKLNYSNYWGGIVFAPVALIVGILILIIVMFRWKATNKMFESMNSISRKNTEHDKWKKL
jgi:uncharacterized membrane protein